MWVSPKQLGSILFTWTLATPDFFNVWRCAVRVSTVGNSLSVTFGCCASWLVLRCSRYLNQSAARFDSDGTRQRTRGRMPIRQPTIMVSGANRTAVLFWHRGAMLVESSNFVTTVFAQSDWTHIFHLCGTLFSFLLLYDRALWGHKFPG